MPTYVDRKTLEGFQGSVYECCLMLNVNELIKTLCRLRNTDEDKYSDFQTDFHNLLDKYSDHDKDDQERSDEP